MSKIAFEVKNCMDCPFVKSRPTYTSDSFEDAYDYFCGHANERKVAGYVEWPSEMPDVPDWCPHLVK